MTLFTSPVGEARTGGSKGLIYLWMRLPEEFPIGKELLDARLFGQLFDEGGFIGSITGFEPMGSSLLLDKLLVHFLNLCFYLKRLYL